MDWKRKTRFNPGPDWQKVGDISRHLNGSTLPGHVYFPVLRIRDVCPGSSILIFLHPRSRISDPKTAKTERGEKICCPTFFCSPKYHKIENYVIGEVQKKIWAN
jgi:hypothetical protein